jgi:hypothetical protein
VNFFSRPCADVPINLAHNTKTKESFAPNTPMGRGFYLGVRWVRFSWAGVASMIQNDIGFIFVSV